MKNEPKYSRWQLAWKYLHYYFAAGNGKGHGTHSPFVFEFITEVLNDKSNSVAYQRVESLREQLLQDRTMLNFDDFGAGSAVNKYLQRHTIKSKKWAQLLFRIVQHYQPKTILELGTSLGVSTAYLAFANPSSSVISCEGSPQIAAKAKKNFGDLGLSIDLQEGNFDDILPRLLNQISTVDLAFIDGNHRSAPTIRYFEQILAKANNSSILIFDDIHWSDGMEKAWTFIQQHPSVKATIDLFFIGLVFFRDEFKERQNFIIRF
jgi:predicted O-methyltransferase YrrM